VLVTLGLSHVEHIVRELPAQERQATTERGRVNGPAVAFLLLAILFIAFGFQIHAFLNSKPLYLNFVPKEQLVWVLPLFWIGFKLLVFPGAAAARRYGSAKILTLGALIGASSLLWVSQADSLETLIAAQMLAGGAWGIVFMAGISTSLGLGTSGREGLILGLWFSMISLATLTRAGLVAGGVKADPALLDALHWAPGLLWLLGGLSLLALLYASRTRAAA
jgi:MFS family permease